MWLAENVHLIGGLLALLCLIGAFRSGRRRWLVENLPTSKASDVSEGLVEVKGSAECEGPPLCSELTNRACIYFKWVVEEKWSRFTNENGKFERETGWDKVAGGERMIPFRLKDESGAIFIAPEGAKIEPVVILDKVCRRNDPLYYGKGPAKAVSNSKHERRFYEIGIPLHQQLYVMGTARTGKGAAEIAADSQAPMFLISAWTEAEVRKRLQGKTKKWVLGGLAVLVAGLFVRDIQALQVISESWPGYVVMIVGYLLGAVAVFVWIPMPKACAAGNGRTGVQSESVWRGGGEHGVTDPKPQS